MPRVQFKIARMMVAVALIAALLGAVANLRRRAHFQELADSHAETARRLRFDHVWTMGPDGGPGVHLPLGDPRLAAYHEELAGKYERAARNPWLPVAPDAPEPR